MWAGRVEGGVGGSPASCVLSTLCEGEAGRRGEGSVAADLPGALRGAVGLRWWAALFLAPPLVWGCRAGSGGRAGSGPALWGRHPTARKVGNELMTYINWTLFLHDTESLSHGLVTGLIGSHPSSSS